MIIHDLEQGSKEWYEFRANHYGASEAPAMMGASKHQSRTELIESKKFGEADPGGFVEKLYEKGHEAEAAARAIAEDIIDQELYPVTGSLEGAKLSASYDGMTMDQAITWEHKIWNKELAAAITAFKETGQPLPKHYTTQMDQQLLVSGAAKVLFMCSDGTQDNCAWCWYEGGDLSYLKPGWEQFEKDLASYEAPEPEVKPVIKSIDDLPALKINVTGMVESSNLKIYEEQALTFIDSISTDLQTDDDFANAEQLVKFCKSAEDEIETAKKAALSQTADIDQLFKTIDKIKEEMRQKRLSLNKLVKDKKEQLRRDIVQGAESKMADFLQESSRTAGIIFTSSANFIGAMKGKKTIKSLRNACDTELARAKIVVTEQSQLVSRNAKAIPVEYQFLFNDFKQIALKSNDDFVNLVNSRVAEHKQKEAARLEAERRRIQEEEERKARAESERKAAQERERIRQEERAKAQAEAQRQREAERAAAKAKDASVLPEVNTATPMPAVKQPSNKTAPPRKQESIYDDGVQLLAMYTDGLGFLPRINNADMAEIYRGEYQATPQQAIEKCINYLESRNNG